MLIDYLNTKDLIMDILQLFSKDAFHKKPCSPFFRHVWISLFLFGLFAVLFAFYVYSEKKISQTHEERHLAFILAHELARNTNNLSSTAHHYVATLDPAFQQHYYEILDIRNGKKPRPMIHNSFYWYKSKDMQRQNGSSSARTVSMLELMRQAKFSKAEFSKLSEALNYAEALSKIEREAMELASSDQETAAHMLHVPAYNRALSAVQKPIKELDQMIDERMHDGIEEAETLSILFLLAFMLSGALLFAMLWNAYKSLYKILGTSPVQLHFLISRIGIGDFSTPIIVDKKREGSVLSWLAETQTSLKQAIAGQKRMTMLYMALSRCNKAIVHSRNEQELFQAICRIAVENGGMHMAWIGMPDPRTNQIVPVASYGDGTDYLKGLDISTDPESPTAHGPTGKAFHEGEVSWNQHFNTSPLTALWHEKGRQYGWKSSAALPLRQQGKIVGVLNLYSSLPDAFDQPSKKLIEEMVADINYALGNLQHEKVREAAEMALSDSFNLLKTIIDTAPLRIFWKDTELTYLGCNAAFARDAGVANAEYIVGKNDYDLCWKEEAGLYQNDDRNVISSGVPKLFFEEPQTTPGGKTIWLSTSKVPLRNKQGETIGILGIYEDITERKLSEERIQYLANFDSLTGLANRMKFNDRLNYTLNLAKRNNESFALLFLDLDRFKNINDSLGHNTGDKVLIELAGRLQSLLREEDTVSRMGGDEFIMLLPNTNREGSEQVTRKLLDIVTRPFVIDQYELTLTACIGIALYPDNGSDIDNLIKNADAAMHRSKLEGPNSYRFFTDEMQEHFIRNLQLTNALHPALALNQLELYYQPQIESENGRITGAEALIRWNHPEFGTIPPSEFIPIAEETGMILPIGEWVLRTAATQAKVWMDKGMAPLIMAVNLSAVQFRHHGFPETVAQILHEIGLPPEYLEIELTESVAMNDPEKAIRIMNKLHKQGIRMSIDDFGTGYSSLSYLKKFKVYKLKIDQSFVRDLNVDPEDQGIVSAIISMSKHLGLRTIAEGVETVGQMDYLRKEGCDEFQGYYFSPPLKVAEFESFREKWNSREPISAD